MSGKDLGVGASSAMGQSWGTAGDVRIEVSNARILVNLKLANLE